MKFKESDFVFFTCGDEDIDDILNLQSSIFSSIDNQELLRKNTKKMFIECVKKPNITIGVKHKNKLIGLGILYIPINIEEDLSNLLIDVDTTNKKCANYKLCMVEKKYRGNNLQYILGKKLELEAKQQGVNILCSTVHPENIYSKNNLIKLGYSYNTTIKKYDNIRDLFYKNI